MQVKSTIIQILNIEQVYHTCRLLQILLQLVCLLMGNLFRSANLNVSLVNTCLLDNKWRFRYADLIRSKLVF